MPTSSPFRQEKTVGLLMELAAKFFLLEANGSSLMTITHADVASDGKRAVILFTVLPVEKEEEALEFAKRKRSDFKEYVKKNSRLGRIPFFDFGIDVGEKNRQRVDEIGFS